MNTFKQLWLKLAKSKKYREEFVASQVKRGIPFQIRTLMKQKEFSQETLAGFSGLTQGVISRAANPDYGNLTLNTVIRIAAGFDVAFIGQFVPFSKLDKWFINLSEDAMRVPTFDEENDSFKEGSNIVSIDTNSRIGIQAPATVGNILPPSSKDTSERLYVSR